MWVTDLLRQRLRLPTSKEFDGAPYGGSNNEGARHRISIADSRPLASNDPVEGSSDLVLLVNFRAGNNSDCLEINQYRENGGFSGEKGIGQPLHN